MKRIIALILIALCICLTSCYNRSESTYDTRAGFYGNNPEVFNDDGSINYESIEYRYDVDTLNTIGYKALDHSIINAWWKEYRWGEGYIGPSLYEMVGFLEIFPEEAEQIESQFTFEPIDVDFADGVHPKDTGLSDFNWGYNADFNKFIVAGRWIGYVYYDPNNNLIYVNVGLK